MKFTCQTGELGDAIMNVSLAVSAKSNIAALEGILVSAAEDGIKLLAYNLELGITTLLRASVSENGAVVIPAKLFSDIIHRIESDTVVISCDERCLVQITGGVSQFSILGMPTEDFPELPAVNDFSDIRLPAATLSSMISQTIFAVAVTDVKPVQTGTLFELEDGELSVVAVDGFRLALRREKLETKETARFIVPGRTLSEIQKLLADRDDEISLNLSKNHILFHIGQYDVISRLLSGDFLDYKAAIPKSGSTRVSVNTRSLINSIERTSLLIFNRLKSPLRVTFEEKLIKMSCSTTIGRAYDECPCATQGESVEMGFNSRYLLDALRFCGGDEVTLEISGPLSPMKVLPPEGDSFLFLVLPMRLKNDAAEA